MCDHDTIDILILLVCRFAFLFDCLTGPFLTVLLSLLSLNISLKHLYVQLSLHFKCGLVWFGLWCPSTHDISVMVVMVSFIGRENHLFKGKFPKTLHTCLLPYDNLHIDMAILSDHF